MKKILQIALPVFLLLSLVAPTGAVIAATPRAHPTAPSVTSPVMVQVVDSFGNVYNIIASGSTAHYAIVGEMISSPYLAYIPWPITGSGSGKTFTWTAHDPNPSDTSYCSWSITATISGRMATGTWVNLGCGGESGTVTLTPCTSTGCGSVSSSISTGNRPGI